MRRFDYKWTYNPFNQHTYYQWLPSNYEANSLELLENHEEIFPLYTLYTLYSLYRVYTLYTLYRLYRLYRVYTLYRLYTLYYIILKLHSYKLSLWLLPFIIFDAKHQILSCKCFDNLVHWEYSVNIWWEKMFGSEANLGMRFSSFVQNIKNQSTIFYQVYCLFSMIWRGFLLTLVSSAIWSIAIFRGSRSFVPFWKKTTIKMFIFIMVRYGTIWYDMARTSKLIIKYRRNIE